MIAPMATAAGRRRPGVSGDGSQRICCSEREIGVVTPAEGENL
jgi:hypothetical protein